MKEENPHAGNAGFVEGRRNDLNGGFVTIYVAAEQGIDVDGNRYAVVCETHSTIVGVQSKAAARPFLRTPEFCEDCMNNADRPAAVEAAAAQPEPDAAGTDGLRFKVGDAVIVVAEGNAQAAGKVGYIEKRLGFPHVGWYEIRYHRPIKDALFAESFPRNATHGTFRETELDFAEEDDFGEPPTVGNEVV